MMAVEAAASAALAQEVVPQPVDQDHHGAPGRWQVEQVRSSTATIVALQNLIVCEPILRFGTEAQKRAWLSLLATGAKLGCFALTESTAGSDLDSIATLARRDGDAWILRGTKSFVTCGRDAQLAIVFAAVEPGARNTLSAFLVPTDSAGLSFGPAYDKLGLRGATAASMTLDDVRLPVGALLGSEGGGREILRFAVEGGRIGAAAFEDDGERRQRLL